MADKLAHRYAKRPPPPDEGTPEGWLSIHRGHGGRPYYEVKIGIWYVWRCTCGRRFHFHDADRDRAPDRYRLE